MSCCLALVNKPVGLLNKCTCKRPASSIVELSINILVSVLLFLILEKDGSKGIPQDHRLKKKKNSGSVF